LMSLASAVPEIFQGVQNSKIGYMVLTTPLSGMIYRWQTATSCDQLALQI